MYHARSWVDSIANRYQYVASFHLHFHCQIIQQYDWLRNPMHYHDNMRYKLIVRLELSDFKLAIGEMDTPLSIASTNEATVRAHACY